MGVSRRLRWPLVGLLLLGSWTAAARAADRAAEAAEFFEKKVRPVLAEHCYKCHSGRAKKPKGGLRLDSRAALLKGGDSGPAVVPGQPENSRLIEAVRYQGVELRMPPRGKLPDAAIADLIAWVKAGAAWPEGDTPQTAGTPRNEFNLAKRQREHWAWQPVRPQEPPAVRDAAWPAGPVDRFLLARLEEKDLPPAAAADQRTLLRRVYFDLVGLPPRPDEIDAFLRDESPEAFARVVERLLASPRFGERWARHWLDLVRYAETRGHEFDYPIPNAYQYRDYVIRAFNADVPYDQLVTEHLAGDLLENPRRHPTQGFNESILGTGFWFLGEEVHSPVDTRQDEADRFDNRIDVMTKTFLGLTVSCARCHDHKFDAISTRDYYALFGFLESSSFRLARFDSLEANRRLAEKLARLRARARPALQRALAEDLRPTVDRLADYLLAAREVMLAGAGSVEAIARAHQLNAALVERWAAYLTRAARDETDPLYPWARAACNPAATQPRRWAELLQPVAAAWKDQQTAAESALKQAEVVVDYGRCRSEDWLPDGVTFGLSPVRPGEVRLGTDPARPITQVFTYAAAEKDPAWDRLRLAPGAENDPGPVGSVVRAGRTIRTPTFQITTGKVFYLVKGTGRAYAAVDQHVMINGPLHGRLLQPIQAGDTFRWVAHDLTPYKGHHVHIELTATDRSDFAVALVVQAANTPASPERPNRSLMQLLAEAGSVEALAAGYQRLFQEVLDRLAADRIVGSGDALDDARLAKWLAQRPDLLTAEGDTGRRLAGVATPFLAEQAQLLAQIRAESRLAPALLDGSGVNEHVFIRGSPKGLGPLVPRRFLEALAGPDPLPVARGSGRLELARLVTDPQRNPFIARVMVNRVWHHLFGRGLVPSVDNFGVLGEAPSHPALLDYLADRFVREGWSVKGLVRLLVLSKAYQMSARPDEQADRQDPQNVLPHRMRLRRLEGEAIRDAMLTVSGQLSEQLGGPSVPVYLTAFQDGRGRPASGPLDGAGRRSIYLAVRRNFLSPFLLAFDTPAPFSTVGRRTVSNVPAQALILMNDPFVHEQAAVWAQRVLAQGGTANERIAGMYLDAFGRPPSAAERQACLDFLSQQAALYGRPLLGPGLQTRPQQRAWADLAHVLFNAKEFIFLN